MDRFFNMDNKFFTFMSRVADLIILNLLCIVCCIPVVTIGPSIAAMFYVTLKMVRNEESYIVRGFFKSFKQNLKQGIVINLIMLAAAILLYFDISICRSTPGTIGKVLMVLFMMILVVYLMIFLYIYPVLAKFYNTIKNTFTNAFLMSIRHLPYTALMILVTAAPVLVFFIPSAQVQSMVILLLVLIGFSGIAYINSHFFVKIFDKYILSIDHVQGDPFASPSKVSVLVSGKTAGFPQELYCGKCQRIALQDELLRQFGSLSIFTIILDLGIITVIHVEICRIFSCKEFSAFRPKGGFYG